MISSDKLKLRKNLGSLISLKEWKKKIEENENDKVKKEQEKRKELLRYILKNSKSF